MLALQITFAICHITHMSWAAVLSAEYHERSRVYGWWQSSNTIGMILVLLLPSIVASQGGSHADGVRAMGWFVVVLLPITVAIAVLRVSEPPTDKANHASWLSGVKLLGRRNVRQLLTADLALGLAAGMAGAMLLFFFRDTKGFAAADTGVFLLFYFIAGLIGAVVWTRIAFRIGKHKALAAAAIFYAVGQAALLLIPPGDRVIAILIYVLSGFGFTAFAFLLRAIMADVGDEERLASGEEKTGLLYSLVTAVSKMGYALSVGITFVALDLVGFVPEAGAANSQQALWGVQFLYVGTPVILALLGAALIWRFPLDGVRHGEIRRRLEEAAATPQAAFQDPAAPTPGATIAARPERA
jgi:Na+/melibiose symporter-like transporter